MAIAGSLRVVEGSEELLPSVLDFAGRTYPRGGHQRRPDYYHWLYARAPNGLASMLLVLDEQQRVVGALHRLFLEWSIQGEVVLVPTLIDLALDPEHRHSGVGIRLIMRGTRDAPHAFINGSNPNSAPVFRGLRYQELHGGHWSRLALRPLGALWRSLVFRLMGTSARPIRPARLRGQGDIHCTSEPSNALLAEVARNANAVLAAIRPHWTVDSIRWRFFHPDGPRHVLFHRKGPDGTLREALVLSLGSARGLNVVRPLLLVASDRGGTYDLIKVAMRSARTAGAHAFVAFSLDPTVIDVLTQLGARTRKDPPATFFHHKRRTDEVHFTNLAVPAGASDLGFDAFPMDQLPADR